VSTPTLEPSTSRTKVYSVTSIRLERGLVERLRIVGVSRGQRGLSLMAVTSDLDLDL
jgi:hypothetical protein